jgi:hypothetical protein
VVVNEGFTRWHPYDQGVACRVVLAHVLPVIPEPKAIIFKELFVLTFVFNLKNVY